MSGVVVFKELEIAWQVDKYGHCFYEVYSLDLFKK